MILLFLTPKRYHEYCTSLKGVTKKFPFDETTLIFNPEKENVMLGVSEN